MRLTKLSSNQGVEAGDPDGGLFGRRGDQIERRKVVAVDDRKGPVRRRRHHRYGRYSGRIETLHLRRVHASHLTDAADRHCKHPIEN